MRVVLDLLQELTNTRIFCLFHHCMWQSRHPEVDVYLLELGGAVSTNGSPRSIVDLHLRLCLCLCLSLRRANPHYHHTSSHVITRSKKEKQRRPLLLSLFLSHLFTFFYSFSLPLFFLLFALVCFSYVSLSLLLFPPSPSLSHFLCLFVHKVSWVLRSCLPASLSEHLSVDYFLNPLIQRDRTLCVVRALVPSLAALPPHVCHRPETGLSLLAPTCKQDMGCFLSASTCKRTAPTVGNR